MIVEEVKKLADAVVKTERVRITRGVVIAPHVRSAEEARAVVHDLIDGLLRPSPSR